MQHNVREEHENALPSFLFPEFLFLIILWLCFLALEILRYIQAVSRQCIKLPEQFLCLVGQLFRGLYHQSNVMIPTDLFISQRRNTLPFQSDLGIGLGSRPHLIDHLSVYSIYQHVSAKRSYCKGNRHC